MKKKLLFGLLTTVMCFTLLGCGKITKNNIMEMLQGNWISRDKITYDSTINEELNTYLIFKDNSVLYTGYTDYQYKEVKIYSLSNMYFGNQNWEYEYVDENTLIHNGNVYNKVANDDESAMLISYVESTIENPLLKYDADNLEEIISQNRMYIINEYIKIENFVSEKYYTDIDNKNFNVDGFELKFIDEIDINNNQRDIVCVGTYERKHFDKCILVE
ncbi:MAG: hypothetical protein PHQ64_00880 [Bacilli bacterium]|nr:hypothetical protein [Bacilli bacterium]